MNSKGFWIRLALITFSSAIIAALGCSSPAALSGSRSCADEFVRDTLLKQDFEAALRTLPSNKKTQVADLKDFCSNATTQLGAVKKITPIYETNPAYQKGPDRYVLYFVEGAKAVAELSVSTAPAGSDQKWCVLTYHMGIAAAEDSRDPKVWSKIAYQTPLKN